MFKKKAKLLPIKIHIFRQKFISMAEIMSLKSDRLDLGFSLFIDFANEQ